MQKVIIDTNVLVSGLISHSFPSKILYEIVLAKKVKICLSDEVFEEYENVLNRGKFLKFPQFKINSEVVLKKISDIATMYYPKFKVDILKDKDDNKFLELAKESSAAYIVTGNFNDFVISEFESTKIISPEKFYSLF